MVMADEFPCLIKKSHTSFICGIEYEIEQIKHLDSLSGHPFILSITKDGSLRDNGFEVITRPLDYDDHISFFNEMYQKIGFINRKEAFSKRTSIHVHVNCGGLTEQQVKTLVLVYAMLEPEFFSLVRLHRKHNIHCVPLSFTSLPSIYKKNIFEYHAKWSKYTALNLKPLSTQCTIEFRHMHGTDNIEEFTRWLNKIKTLYEFIVGHPEFMLGAYLAEGNTCRDLHELIYDMPISIPFEEFTSSTIDVKESFL